MKFSLTALLLLALLVSIEVDAQKTSRPAQKKTTVKKRASGADTPPRQEQIEDIPPPPPAPKAVINFDTTSIVNDELTMEVRKLMAAMQFKEIFLSSVSQTLDQNMERMPGDFAVQFKERFMTELRSPQAMGWIENSFIRTYRKHFSIEDIKQLVAFYETPIGKKFVQVQPSLTNQIMQQCSMIGEYLGAKAAQDVMSQTDKK